MIKAGCGSLKELGLDLSCLFVCGNKPNPSPCAHDNVVTVK